MMKLFDCYAPGRESWCLVREQKPAGLHSKISFSTSTLSKQGVGDVVKFKGKTCAGLSFINGWKKFQKAKDE